MDFINILLIVIFLCFIIPLVFYMFMIDQKDKEEWYKNKIQREAQEKKDEVWVKKSFRPKMLRSIKRNRTKIIIWSIVLLSSVIVLWLFLFKSVTQ